MYCKIEKHSSMGPELLNEGLGTSSVVDDVQENSNDDVISDHSDEQPTNE